MRYTKVETGRAAEEPGGRQQLEADDLAGRWASASAPFVLVTRKAWRPPTDVYETPADVVVKMEIAGVREDELSVVIADDVLSITGRRDDEAEGRKIGYHQMGISYGEFAVYVKLPGPIDPERIIARYEAGFLQVRLPKALPRESRSVRISVTDNPVES